MGRLSRTVRWVGALALVALGATTAVHVLSQGPNTLTGPPGNAFSLNYPNAWQPVPRPELADMPGHPVAVLDLNDGVGSMTITRDLPAESPGRRLIKQVKDDFQERLADYRLLSARVLRTGAGDIFVYSYLRPNAAAVHTVALVPAGNHSYVLDSVARFGARNVLAQIGAMIRSFKPR